MTRPLPLAALAAVLALAACDSKPANTGPQPIDPMAINATTPATPVEMPPAIKSTKAYRCKDNSVVYVDLFQGDKQANVKTDPKATPVVLKGEAGKELTAEGGYAVTVKGDTLAVTLPGKAKQDCEG